MQTYANISEKMLSYVTICWHTPTYLDKKTVIKKFDTVLGGTLKIRKSLSITVFVG